jgi:hypothetical protein
VSVAIHQPSGAVPLPPPRPFDLGSASRNPVLVIAAAATPPQRPVMPPRRSEVQASAEKALYLVEPPARPLEHGAASAFGKLKPVKPTETVD